MRIRSLLQCTGNLPPRTKIVSREHEFVPPRSPPDESSSNRASIEHAPEKIRQPLAKREPKHGHELVIRQEVDFPPPRVLLLRSRERLCLQWASNHLMLHRRLGPLACVFVASLTTTTPARASAPVTLDWSAPVGCPSGDDVLDEVSRLLGTRPETNEPPLRVTAEVKRKEEGPFVVRLEIPNPAGPRFREVSAVSCAALAQATALILALMIDPEAALAEPLPPSPPPLLPVPPPSEPPLGQTQIPRKDAPTNATVLAPIIPVPLGRLPPLLTPTALKTTPKPAPIHRAGFSFAAHFAMDFGSLPSPAYGPSGSIGLLFKNWHLAVGGAYFAEQKNLLTALPLAGSNVSFFAIHGGVGIPVELHERVELVPRIRLEIGRFAASSYGVSQPGQGSAVTVGVNAGGAVSLKIVEKFRLVGGFDVLLYLVHPQFLVTGVGVAHQPSALVGRLSLGGELRF